jgi:hypothetical protein
MLHWERNDRLTGDEEKYKLNVFVAGPEAVSVFPSKIHMESSRNVMLQVINAMSAAFCAEFPD